MIVSTLEHILTNISLSIILVSILIKIYLKIFFVDENIKLSNSSEKCIFITFLCITGLLATHWISSGHFPLSDLSESLLFLSWSFALINSLSYLKKNTKLLSTIISPINFCIQAFATSGLFTEIKKSSILVPALQSEWLIMHVSMMIVGYAALICGSLLSVALMVITFRKNENIFKMNYIFSAKNFYKIQLSKELDYWSYRVISLGFIFLTIGILSGALWANQAWGSYWSWDPKETWAFITWIVFSIYLHTRRNRTFEGATSAIVASIGFLLIWICYFGVNLIGLGLHTYGSFSRT